MFTHTGTFDFSVIDVQRERAKILETNPIFMAGLRAIGEQNPDIDVNNMFVRFAGSQHGKEPGPYEFADTPEKVLFYYREVHPKPVDKTQQLLQRSQERDAKAQAQAHFAADYAEWVEDCRQRKIDQAEEKCRFQQSMAVIRDERNSVIDASKYSMELDIARARSEHAMRVSTAVENYEKNAIIIQKNLDMEMNRPVPPKPVKRQ